MDSPERTVFGVRDNRLVYSIHNPEVHYFVNFFFSNVFKRPMCGGGNAVFKILMRSQLKELYISQYEIMNVTTVHRCAWTSNSAHFMLLTCFCLLVVTLLKG